MWRSGGPSGLSAHLGAFKEAGTTQMEQTSSVEPPTADKSSLLGADFLLVHRPTWNSAATLKPFTVTSCSDNVSWRRLVSPRCSVLSSGHLAKTFFSFFSQIIQHQLTLCDISDYNQHKPLCSLPRTLLFKLPFIHHDLCLKVKYIYSTVSQWHSNYENLICTLATLYRLHLFLCKDRSNFLKPACS